jgi:hypothetical protein
MKMSHVLCKYSDPLSEPCELFATASTSSNQRTPAFPHAWRVCQGHIMYSNASRSLCPSPSLDTSLTGLEKRNDGPLWPSLERYVQNENLAGEQEHV